MSVEGIGNGLKTRLETISGLKVYAPNQLPDSIGQFPAAVIVPLSVNYRTVLSSTDSDYVFRIILLFTKQDTPSAMNKALDYLDTSGTYSVLAAIEADKTLSSNAETLIVVSNSGFGYTSWGGINYLSTEFLVNVWG